MMTVEWHGAEQEITTLRNAVARNCTCTPSDEIVPLDCPAHKMLLQDQRALDGLLFAHRIAACLRREEDAT